MSEKFEPYHQWLGIPPSEQPPHYYRLLGIAAFEESPTVIENAADQRMAHLRTFQAGRHGAESQRLLNEIAAARICLLNPLKKNAYDQRLRQDLQPNSGSAGGLADLLDLELAAAGETKRTSASVITSQDQGKTTQPKKSQPKPMLLIGIAAPGVVVVGSVAIWLAMWRGGGPSDRGLAKAELVPSAKVAKNVLPDPPPPSTRQTPLVASLGPKQEPKADVPTATPVAKQPEPKADEVAKTAP